MRGRRSLLLVSVLALVCLGAVPARTAHAGSCQGISDAIAAVEVQIAKLDRSDPGPFGHPGEPLKPQGKPLTPQQKAQLKTLQAKLDTLQAQLAACEVPPPTPALTVPAITAAGIRVPDPQIAVGRKYLAAIDTSTIVFYDKGTMQPLQASTGFAYANNPIGASTLFRAFFAVIDAQMKLPANACDATKPGWDKSFDPAQPNKAIPGCIDAAYDTRVLYDAPRERFWIESAVRNPLWPCKPKPGVNIGGFFKPDGVTLIDPDPSNAKVLKCHTDWNTSWAHRFIAIAVSQVGADGHEDLTKPFHQYTLVDAFADWPIMSVHGAMLVLTHRDAGAPLAVFDATALANGVHDNSSMVVKPLATFPASSFGAGSIAPASAIYLVNVHGSPSEPAYVVSSNGNSLLISGLVFGKTGAPKVLAGASVLLATPLHQLRHSPVYRNGKLYLTDFGCGDASCTRYVARLIRVPVGVNKAGTAVVASGSGTPGFINYQLNPPQGDISYALPAVDVNAADDMVVAFQRGRRNPATFIPWAARYSTYYHDKAGISNSALLHDGVWTKGVTVPADPAGSGVIDLAGIAVDPSDDRTIWMSHAYSNGARYTQIMGAVKP